jgi:uncharacterized phage-associated protein
MTMPYNAKAIANFLLELAKARGQSLTPMKLQKLIYYANGWHSAIKGEPLINEQVEAWDYGPVIPSIYKEFREYGNQPITSPATEFEFIELPDSEGMDFRFRTPRLEDDLQQTEFARALLKRVWEVYGGYTAVQLSNMTHAPGTPWRQVYDRYSEQIPRGTDIPWEAIRDHFVAEAKTRAEAKSSTEMAPR